MPGIFYKKSIFKSLFILKTKYFVHPCCLFNLQKYLPYKIMKFVQKIIVKWTSSLSIALTVVTLCPIFSCSITWPTKFFEVNIGGLSSISSTVMMSVALAGGWIGLNFDSSSSHAYEYNGDNKIKTIQDDEKVPEFKSFFYFLF